MAARANFGDEQWVDKTQLEAPAAEHKLMVTAGPAAGLEFPLQGTDAVIGRAPDNALSVPDQSVSRRHARLRRDGALWAVSDLKSGNGTFVNGLPVGGEIILRPGDVITVGDSSLRYVAPPLPTVSGESHLTAATQVGAAGGTGSISGSFPGRDEHTQAGTLPGLTTDPGLPPGDLGDDQTHHGPAPITTLPEGMPAVAFDDEAPRTVNLQQGRPSPAAAVAGGTAGSGPKATVTIPVQPGSSGQRRRVADLPSRTRARREAEERKKRRTMLLWGGAAAVVCLIPIGVRAAIAMSNQRREQQAVEARARIDADFQAAKDAMRAGRFEDARAAFLRVQAADPSAGAQNFLARIDGEEKNQQQLRSAEEALEHGQIAKAADFISLVRPDTSQREALIQAREHLAIRARERLAVAQKSLEAGDADAALGITTDVLKALPDDRDALRLRDAALAKRGPVR